MVIKTKAKKDGIIEIKSAYEDISPEQTLAELSAVIEDVVSHLIKLHRMNGDTKTQAAQYYNTIAGILTEMAKEE